VSKGGLLLVSGQVLNLVSKCQHDGHVGRMLDRLSDGDDWGNRGGGFVPRLAVGVVLEELAERGLREVRAMLAHRDHESLDPGHP
jgi:hypothetical protein